MDVNEVQSWLSPLVTLLIAAGTIFLHFKEKSSQDRRYSTSEAMNALTGRVGTLEHERDEARELARSIRQEHEECRRDLDKLSRDLTAKERQIFELWAEIRELKEGR